MSQSKLGALGMSAALLAVAVAWPVWSEAASLPEKVDSASAQQQSDAVKPAAAERKIKHYRNPMGEPDISPVPKKDSMGMDYIPVYEDEVPKKETPPTDAGSNRKPALERKVKYYRNPMGQPDTSPVPKKDSMGMDYIPVYEDENADDDAVKVSPGKIQRTGVETAVAEKRSLARIIRAPGVVQADETRIAVVAPRFDGYVVSVAKVTTGSHVKKGDELATIFGQEILNQAARLLVEQNTGWRNDDSLAPPGQSERPGGAVGAVRRLKNLGVSEDFIQQVKRERRVPDTFPVRAPIDGVITERSVFDGQGFKTGDAAFRIEDYSSVWMVADIAEGELGAISLGQSVAAKVRAFPGRVFNGTINLIYPNLVKETRTARVRVELKNSDLALRPGMYGDVEISSGAPDLVLAVPSSAIIDSGQRQVVLVDRGDGRYEPAEVHLGRRGDDQTEVLSGLSEGDRIVVNGNFLIDSESNLQAALKALERASQPEIKP